MEKKEFEQLLKVLLKEKIEKAEDFDVFWNNCSIDDNFTELYIEFKSATGEHLGKIFINIEQFKEKMKDETDLEYLVQDFLKDGTLYIKFDNYMSFKSFLNEEYTNQRFIIWEMQENTPSIYLSNFYNFKPDYSGSYRIKDFYNIINN